ALVAGAKPIEQGDLLLGSLAGFDHCIYLFLVNLDSVSHELARSVLNEVRELAGDRKAVAFLVGEYDLRNFVQGPGSEVTNFATIQYVLQGCGFQCYESFLKDYFLYTAFPLPDATTRRELFRRTGGNTDVTAMI